MGSDNPSGAVNQQERLDESQPGDLAPRFERVSVGVAGRSRRESSEAIRRAPSLKLTDEDMVQTPWRHGETV